MSVECIHDGRGLSRVLDEGAVRMEEEGAQGLEHEAMHNGGTMCASSHAMPEPRGSKCMPLNLAIFAPEPCYFWL